MFLPDMSAKQNKKLITITKYHKFLHLITTHMSRLFFLENNCPHRPTPHLCILTHSFFRSSGGWTTLQMMTSWATRCLSESKTFPHSEHGYLTSGWTVRKWRASFSTLENTSSHWSHSFMPLIWVPLGDFLRDFVSLFIFGMVVGLGTIGVSDLQKNKIF